MAVTLIGSGGLFTLAGKVFYAQQVTATAKGTTVGDEVLDVVTEFRNQTETFKLLAAAEGATRSYVSWRDNTSLESRLASTYRGVMIEMIEADATLPNLLLTTAIAELIEQMIGAGSVTAPDDSVDASTSAISVAATAGNNSNGVIIASPTDGVGRNSEFAMAEVIRGVYSGPSSVSLSGESAVPVLNTDWPKGSGTTTSVSLSDTNAGILNNGGFITETARNETPDGWTIHAAVPGTTIGMTEYETQTLTVTGTPTGGTYTIGWTNLNGSVQVTTPLAFDATGSAVQTALRALNGLESARVVSTGTTPNYIHGIFLEHAEPAGNQNQITADATLLTGGTPVLTPATTAAGTAHVYFDRCAEFIGDASSVTALRQDLTSSISSRTVYAFNAFLKVDVFPAAGVLTIRLIDGTGTVIADDQGTNNTFTVDPQSGGDLSTSAFTAINGFFRTPEVIPDTVFLEIKMTTAMSAGSILYIDQAVMIEPDRLYPTGPYVAGFAGTSPVSDDDTWTLTVTNDRAGSMHEYFHRNGFLSPGQLLPSDSGGTETVLDSLIS